MRYAMRVLVFPNDRSAIGNPYCELLYGNMEKLGVVTEPFTPLRALTGRYEIFHLHWPEYYLNTSPAKALVGTFGLLFFVMWRRFRGTRIVWTAHNIHSHNKRYLWAERWFWQILTPMLDGYIALSETSARQARTEFPALRSIPCSVIPHGHYRSSYPATITKSSARLRLGIAPEQSVVLFFGGISPYKNVPHLMETFQRAALANSTLVIAGCPASQTDRRLLLETVKESNRIQLHLKRIPTDEVQVFFAAADLVVLPFLEITNSGSAILALSFDRPVLVPDCGSLPELQAQVGPDWIRTYRDELSVGELEAGLAWSRNCSRAPQPNLRSFDWSSIARDTLYLYETLTARRFAGDHTPPAEAGRSMIKNDRRLKVAVMVNIIAPAKMPVFSGLAERFDLLLLHGGMESNRDSWFGPEKKIPGARIKRVWGWQIRWKKMAGKIRDSRHLHITPAFIWYLLRFCPAVVVTNEMGFRTLQALLYGTLARKPVWVWWGGTPHTERLIGPARKMMRFIVSRWARRWFSYGQTSTEYLLSLGVPRDRIVQIQNSVDEGQYKADAEPEFRLHPRPVLLHVGQFIALKGIDLFLQASAILQKDGREFSLLFVGSGPDKQKLKQLASDLQLKNVHFLGSRESEKMPSVYRSGDVLVFPSLADIWGLVANEAVLCGLPVLCSKYAGCAPELFTDASIFDPENPDEFVAKLREAVAGRLPKPDASRIKTTPEIVNRMIFAIEASTHRQVGAVHTAQARK
jgi:glycosyltransferase involved in cell wall biosynthesis